MQGIVANEITSPDIAGRSLIMDPLTGVGTSFATAGSPPVANAASGAPAVVAPPAATAAPASAAPAAPVDARALQQAVNGINEYLKSVDSGIEFSVDQETGTTVVKVLDNSSGKVVRQIPSTTALALAQEMDKLSGLLIHTQA
jgi:flagellar protein FlaG